MNSTAKELVKGIYMDLIPGFAACVDFGIEPSVDPTRVFGALQHGLKAGTFSEEELSAALGNGDVLTELVNRGNNSYGKGLTIKTQWDNIPDDDEDEEEYYANKEAFR